MLLLQRSCPESSFADGRDYDDDEDDDENWKTLGSPTAMYATVPETLQERIQEQLKLYLSLCDTDNCLHQSSETSDNINMIQTNNSPWKELFANESSGHCAYQRTDAQGRATIKSTAVLNHPVKQVFALLIDISRRQEYETNIRADERMQILNPHTFLDYYAYKPVSIFSNE